MQQLLIHKHRTNVITVSVGYDVSDDVITSQIRAEKDPESDLLAEWSVEFLTDGTDGELVLTLDDSLIDAIDKSTGYMDIMRMSAGEPLALFDEILEVIFRNTVTA